MKRSRTLQGRGFIGLNEANPSRWCGHLDKLLPPSSRGHRAAMPYADVPRTL
jgi:hypothetical protein